MERKKKKLIYNVVVSLLLITGLVWVCSHFVHLGNVAYTDNAQSVISKRLTDYVINQFFLFTFHVLFNSLVYIHISKTIFHPQITQITQFLRLSYAFQKNKIRIIRVICG